MSLLSLCFVIGILVYSISVLVLYWLFRNDIIYNNIKKGFEKKIVNEPNPEFYRLAFDPALKFIMLTPGLNTVTGVSIIIEIILKGIWFGIKFVFDRKK